MAEQVRPGETTFYRPGKNGWLEEVEAQRTASKVKEEIKTKKDPATK